MNLSGHDNDSDPASLHSLHGSGAKLVLKVWLHHHDDSQPRLPLRCHHLRMDPWTENNRDAEIAMREINFAQDLHTKLQGSTLFPTSQQTDFEKNQVLFILNLSIAVTDMLPVLMLVAFTLIGGDLAGPS